MEMMMLNKKMTWIWTIVALAVVAAIVVGFYFFYNAYPAFFGRTVIVDRCSADNKLSEAQSLGRLVHHFEDVKFVAILTSREQLVQPILKLQDLRYQAEDMDLPDCLSDLEVSSINYMNSVILYLSHHMAGMNTEQVRAEFLSSEELLKTYQQVYAQATGSQFELPTQQATLSP
jgi:hypothetical protein